MPTMKQSIPSNLEIAAGHGMYPFAVVALKVLLHLILPRAFMPVLDPPKNLYMSRSWQIEEERS